MERIPSMRIPIVTVQLKIVPPFAPKHAGTVLAAGIGIRIGEELGKEA
jgi:hypothetical protein